MLNNSIHYQHNVLHCDDVAIPDITAVTETPVYIYSLPRILANLERIRSAFTGLDTHIHYSVKANANLAILKTLIDQGVGIDAVSVGEIHRALRAGCKAEDIVFAGVGKTPDELTFAVQHGIGWINVENIGELQHINTIADGFDRPPVRVALRLNPDITANTHPYIATGHGGAKFGLPAEVVREVFATQDQYPNISFEGIHLHIGSQLHDTDATRQAVQIALDLIAPYSNITTVNIGGGLPVQYQPDEVLPSFDNFVDSLRPLLKDYRILLEPGRSLVADAGMLITTVLYVKQQAGQRILITDASMAELIRPALYQAHHEIVSVQFGEGISSTSPCQIVGPVCETADVLGRDIDLPEVLPGQLLAALTAGAYGMVMASNYNQRLRPPEVVVMEDGAHWQIARRRETWDDLLRYEQ